MSSQGIDLITAASQANNISSILTSNVEYITSNIQPVPNDTKPYIHYKFQSSSNFICDSISQKHLINNGGVYTSSNSLLLSNSNYVIIPSEDWNSYNDLTISGWFKTQNTQTGDKLLDFSYTYPLDNQLFRPFFYNTTNLLAWYKFDHSITTDSSPNGITLTYTAGTGLMDIDVINKIVGSSSLVQKNSTLSSTNSASTAVLSSSSTILNLQTSTTRISFSIAFWVMITTTSIRHVVFAWGTTGTNGCILGLILTNGTFVFSFNVNDLSTINNTILANTWYHIVCTYNTSSRQRQIYVNGSLSASDISASSPTCSSGSFKIGYISTITGYNFIGNLDDFRVYNKILSSQEIYDLYNIYQNTQKSYQLSNYNISSGLIAWYKFNNNYNDSSGNNTLTAAGSFSFDSINFKNNQYSVAQTTLSGSQTANTIYLESTSANLNLTNKSFSISFWIKMSIPDTSTTFRILSFGNVGTNGNMILIGWFNTYFRLSFYNDNLNIPPYSSPQIENEINNRWVHLCFTFNNITKFREIYVNGIKLAFGTSTNIPTVSSIFRIGHTPSLASGVLDYNASFVGNIDDLRIYNRVLTQDEINLLNISKYNMSIVRKNTTLSFQINNTSVYEPTITDNTWNHLIWNIKNRYIQINNGEKNYYNKQSLTPVSIRYPPYPMTDYENTFAGYTYRATAYDSAGGAAWKAFDFTDNISSTYNTNLLNASAIGSSGITFSSDTYQGYYLGIDMGQTIILDYYQIWKVNLISATLAVRRPKNWRIYATNNDACWIGGVSNGLNTGPGYGWVNIDERSNQTSYDDTTNFYIANTIPYRYYAMHVNAIIDTNTSTRLHILDWAIYGYNPDTIIQQYPLIPMTGFTTEYNGIIYRACAYSYYTPEQLTHWKAFDRSLTNLTRYVSDASFDINGVLNISGVYFGNDTNYKGVYLGIDMGSTIIMKYYYIIQSIIYGRLPRNWKIYATNDDRCWNETGGTNGTPCFKTDAIYNWKQIDIRIQESTYNNDTRFTLDNNIPYRYYALHVNALIGETTTGGFYFDIYEWRIFGYPYYSYSNTLGSSTNNGLLTLKDFKIYTTNEEKIYDTANLINNNGVYTLDYTNSIIVRPSNQLSFTSTNWNILGDLTISGWFKTEDFVSGDIIFETKFSYYDMIVWYKFDIVPPNTDNDDLIIDSSLNSPSRNLTRFNVIINTVDYKTGGACAQFINGNSYFSILNNSINFFPDNFTVAFWCKLTGVANTTQNIISSGIGFGRWNISLWGSNLELWINSSGIVLNSNFADTTWKHVVLIIKKSQLNNITLYINGIFINNFTLIYSLNSTISLFIGANQNGNQGLINNSLIDDVRIYNRTLSLIEILGIYNNSYTNNTISYTNLKIANNNNNQLSFEIDNTSVYQTAYPLNNSWNHIIWNVSSSTNNQGFIRINNGTKINFNEPVNTIPLTRYPPIAMTNGVMNLTGYGYNNGTYISSASSIYSPNETHYNAFNQDNSTVSSTNFWTTSQDSYSSTNGSYLGTVSTIISGVSVLGEWLQIQLPIPIILNNYNIYTWPNVFTRAPKEFRIAGSNDGLTWTLVDSQTNITGYTTSGKSFTISSNTKAYTYYRLVILSNNNSIYITIAEWELFGYPLYPYTNTLGSMENNGKLFISDFKIITNPMTTTLEDQLYSTTPDNGSIINTYLTYENVRITPNEFRIYNTDYVKDYPYLYYEFKSLQELIVDSSSNIRLLTNYGGTYLQDNGKNSIILKNNCEASFSNVNWSTFNNLTISGWFKTENFISNDKLLEFKYKLPYPYDISYQIAKYPKTVYTAASPDITSSSFNTTYYDWEAFDGQKFALSTSYASGFNYTRTNNVYNGTQNINGYYGDWIKIDLKEEIILTRYDLSPEDENQARLDRCPYDFKIFGSTDDTIWNELDAKTAQIWSTATTKTFNISNTVAYRYYILVVNQILPTYSAGNNCFFITEWELYGYPVIFKNITIKRLNNDLTFNIDDTPVYTTPYNIDNNWTHIIWNVKNSINSPFVRINNGTKQTYNTIALYSESYTNKLGSIANLGDLYISDFKIITDLITPELENRLYNNPKEYSVITDEDTITNTINNISALYYQGSKKLETNSTGVAVKGNVTATGNVLSYYSDMRLKEVVSEIDNPMEKIMNINTFKYTPNQLALSMGVQNNNIEVGVSAQDVNEVLPEIISLAPCDRDILESGEIISKSGENYMTVSYPRMVPLLIECIKKLNKEIDKL
jgi:hypothetical protein